MKILEAQSVYRDLSGAASDISRKLNFSGIAIIWVFNSGSKGQVSVPKSLLLPAALIVLSLTLDLLQYASGAVAWGIYAHTKELRGTAPDEDFDAPIWINWLPLAFFYGKLAAVAAAYWFLLVFLIPMFK